MNEETVELTRVRRGRPIKKESESKSETTTTTIISVPISTPTEPISNSTDIQVNKEKQNKKSRKPRVSKAESVQKVLEPLESVPVPSPVTIPVSNISNVPVKNSKKKRIVKEKVIEEAPLGAVASAKLKQQEVASLGEVVNVLESEAGKKRINSIKKVYEEDDIKYRMNLVKSTIKDKQITKTKKENEYLKKKLAELERELNELYDSSSSEEVVVPKKTKQKPIKLPIKEVDNNKVQYMSRQDVMRSFGF